MTTLPTGTVTFLFTDIEGSTRLLHELGEGYVAIRDAHQVILRAAIAEGGGIELSTEGDSFFAVFPTPAGAVEAVVGAQRGLAGHEWPPGSPVRVRMGLHTGEGALGGEDYVGMDVNRTARIAAAAHGGQVLVSGSTHALVEHALPVGVAFRDLGEHRLKDIPHPERLFDLAIDGLEQDFPPPRTLDARPNNLPVPLTSFVGRGDEIEDVRRLLGGTRLLTLTGAGGTGKSRLAIRVAADALTDYRDGAFFVDLSAVTDPALLPAAMAKALGVPEVPGRPILDAVTDHVRDRELLLIVDNFEQVVEASPVVETLLAAAPGLTVLVTSRIVLSLHGEQEYEVPPLEPPDPERLPDLPTLRAVEAVRLFTERAVAVQPRFEVTERNAPAVAGITARLDGLPLAIELAATRTKVLTPEQMLPRLEKRLSLLTSRDQTLPERQRTLRGAIAWSYDLLEASEGRLFARLSVFTGGWTFESAEEVCEPEALDLDALEGLTSLLDKSLIRADDTGNDRRFHMLETIREFGLEQLGEAGEFELLMRRHGEHYLAFAVAVEPNLTGEDQRAWLDRCEREHPNLRAALRWAIGAGDADRAQAAAGALWRFWQQRGHLAEGRRWLAEILAMPSGQGPTQARAKALIGAGGIDWWQEDRIGAGTRYAEALDIERALGDPSRVAEALYNLSFVVAGDDLDAATGMLEESLGLFRQAGDERGVAGVLALLLMPDAQAGNWPPVAAGLEEVVAIWRRVGDQVQLAFDLVWLAYAQGRLGRRAEARAAALEALELFRGAENPTGIGIALTDLAFLAAWEGRHEDALRLAGAAQSVRTRIGGPPGPIGGFLAGDPAAEAREHLPTEDANRAWAEGLGMSVGDAVAAARATD